MPGPTIIYSKDKFTWYLSCLFSLIFNYFSFLYVDYYLDIILCQYFTTILIHQLLVLKSSGVFNEIGTEVLVRFWCRMLPAFALLVANFCSRNFGSKVVSVVVCCVRYRGLGDFVLFPSTCGVVNFHFGWPCNAHTLGCLFVSYHHLSYLKKLVFWTELVRNLSWGCFCLWKFGGSPFVTMMGGLGFGFVKWLSGCMLLTHLLAVSSSAVFWLVSCGFRIVG